MNKRAWYSIFTILTIIAVLSWLAVLSRPASNLKIIACDVGQGDATIVINGSFQMLIDGGPNNKVVSCLSKYIPFWDRQIEVMVSTHPDSDHYVGLVEVLKRYNVKNVLITEANKDNAGYRELIKYIGLENTNVIFARENQQIRYSSLSIDILSPSQNMFVNADSKVLGSMNIDEDDSNSYSIVLRLVYGEFDALFTGDLTPSMAEGLISRNLIPDVEYLQVPHHGSKNGLTEDLLAKASPEVSVISAGKNNRYGHPHEDVLQMLRRGGSCAHPAEAGCPKILGTYDVGDVVVESDGKSLNIF